MKEQRKCRVCGKTEDSAIADDLWVADDVCQDCKYIAYDPVSGETPEELAKSTKPTVVSFASIKGGTGKTNIAILTAKCLAAAGLRVLLVDFDLNNSLSFHFLDRIEGAMEKSKQKFNVYKALGDENNNLCDFAQETGTPGISIIASTPYLADLRTLSEKRLKRMIPTIYGKFDICIIDCPPTYDNIVLNAVNASDYTITPVLLDLFSYNAAEFFAGILPRDVEGLKAWFVLINGYNRRFQEAASGRQYDFLKLYKDNDFPLTPTETWFPWTKNIHLCVDYYQRLSNAKGHKETVYNPDLYKAVVEFAGCFIGDNELVVPEVF